MYEDSVEVWAEIIGRPMRESMRSARLETVPSHWATTSGGDQGRA